MYKYLELRSSLKDSESEEVITQEDIWGNSERFGIPKDSPSDGYSTDLSQFPKLAWYNTVIKNTEHNIDINTEYPQFVGGSTVTKLNLYINDLIKKKIEDDKVELKELLKTSGDDGMNTHIYLTTTYRIVGVTKGVVSIEFILTDFTGGGNGNHDYPITINWDLKSNRLLKNSELFCTKNYVETLMPLVRKDILDYFQSSDHIAQPVSNGMISELNSATENKADNWNYFLITKNGVLAVFPPYQITSGAEGIVRSFVPFKDIQNLVCVP
jgi:hypothetical protein